ncbi:MAG: aminotransferase class III-fold pyridoxal phosphate-dependent enzyme, partial [Dehalococcoidia bacterium]|nr:aminotransferase class III-fold pyridoxal phosphate-dependent enzyme [Dehalococcoidia bacterium]
YRRAHTLIPGASQTNSKRAEAYALGAYPIYVDRGEGARVWDVDGNEYIDFRCGLGPITLGYAIPEVDEAVARQLVGGVVFSYAHPLEV